MRKNKGKVFLVGFGPGAPDLITRRGEEALSRAEVIFYDHWVDRRYLRKFQAEKIYVGKQKGKHGRPQDEINELLYQAARDGKCIVRLKGGDPFIFGRGGEEQEYLEARSIRVVVIPGVTAALAAAACAGIPLTHRGVSSSVAFCAGHPTDKIQTQCVDTIVYYMAGSNAMEIMDRLIRNGWDKETPVAFISNATLPMEKIRISTLEKEIGKQKRVQTPLIMIVGKTVGMAKEPEKEE